MPRFDDGSVEMKKQTLGHFGFSAANIDDLGSSEYTLVTIVADRSSSTTGFQNEMEAALKECIKACRLSPRADFLMLRVLAFASQKEEIHGFKLLQDCNPDDYDGVLSPRGTTMLHDSVVDSIEATANYGKQLQDEDIDVNGIVIVITDGDDNESKCGPAQVKDALAQALRKEALESLITILVAVNSGMCRDILDDYHKDVGFTQFVEVDDATEKTLAKLGEFMSQSVSSQSQSLGSGGPSQPISVTF
jgi:uncharacterized protein YegL